MKSKILNLQNTTERTTYSNLLQNFEKEFIYPLSNKLFNIQHGTNSFGSDYFTFFEQIGIPYFIVIENNNKIIGCCCLVLKNIKNKKIWYICDFKISKEYRGQKIYRLLMIKYFLKFYFKSQHFFAINMSPPKNNGLIKHGQKIFKFLNVKYNPLYLHTFTLYDYLNNKVKFTGFTIVTNDNIKDIIINNEKQPLLHLIYAKNSDNYNKVVDLNIYNKQTTVMVLTTKENKLFTNDNVQEISNINNTHLNFLISSSQI